MRRTWQLAFTGVGMLFAGWAVAACAGIFGFDRLEVSEEDASVVPDGSVPAEASPGIDAGIDAAQRPGCDQLGVPAPPTSASQCQLPMIITALNLFDLGILDGGVPTLVGYNLDRTCTDSNTDPTTSSCAPPTTGAPTLDKDNPPGLDNVGSALIALPGPDSPFAPKKLNKAIADGKFGAIITIALYNGEANDDNVKVNFFPAIGLKNDATPNFDSKDLWVTDANYDATGDTSLFVQTGYVSNGRLVVQYPKVQFDVPLGDIESILTLTLYDVVVSATIVADGAGFELTDGVMAGRWRTTDMLGAIGRLDNGSGGSTPVCEDAVFKELVPQQICGAVDLAPSAADDVNPPAAANGKAKVACRAISVGAKFTAYYVESRQSRQYRPDAGSLSCPPSFSVCP